MFAHNNEKLRFAFLFLSLIEEGYKNVIGVIIIFLACFFHIIFINLLKLYNSFNIQSLKVVFSQVITLILFYIFVIIGDRYFLKAVKT